MTLTPKGQAIKDKKVTLDEDDQHVSHENEVWQSATKDLCVLHASIGAVEISSTNEEDQTLLVGLESLGRRAMDAIMPSL
jgi:hypothetical protein